MWFGVVSLFPEMFTALNCGITGRALKSGLLELALWNPRDYALDKHRTVDDRPYGGGAGMVMMGPPLQVALAAARQAAPVPVKTVCLSPQGKRFDQQAAAELAALPGLILLAGRYEGIDERLLDTEIDEQWSVGDFVLSGGELAAMTMIDVMTRLLPGALGHEDSAPLDSLSCGLLKYPQYTRPEEFAGSKVPDILLSGDHQAIARWRLQQSLGRTWQKRPDLLAKRTLSKDEQVLLNEFKSELSKE